LYRDHVNDNDVDEDDVGKGAGGTINSTDGTETPIHEIVQQKGIFGM
jgi:hypothetical protein